MLPCRSMARVRPSGETATDMDVPSLTVTSSGGAAATEEVKRPTSRMAWLTAETFAFITCSLPYRKGDEAIRSFSYSMARCVDIDGGDAGLRDR